MLWSLACISSISKDFFGKFFIQELQAIIWLKFCDFYRFLRFLADKSFPGDLFSKQTFPLGYKFDFATFDIHIDGFCARKISHLLLSLFLGSNWPKSRCEIFFTQNPINMGIKSCEIKFVAHRNGLFCKKVTWIRFIS